MQPAVSEVVVYVQLQLYLSGEGSAVLKVIIMCSYNTTALGKGAQT